MWQIFLVTWPLDPQTFEPKLGTETPSGNTKPVERFTEVEKVEALPSQPETSTGS